MLPEQFMFAGRGCLRFRDVRRVLSSMSEAWFRFRENANSFAHCAPIRKHRNATSKTNVEVNTVFPNLPKRQQIEDFDDLHP